MAGVIRTRFTSCSIPRELWYEIANEVEPRDVLSLQSTCSLTRDALTNRTFWISVLRSLCDRQCIFFHSYPIEDMDIGRIQRATLAPARFARLLKEHSTLDLAEATAVLQPTCRTEVTVGEPGVHEEVHLVPGGRFLVTATRGSINLWDLGAPDRPALSHPIHIARIAIDKHPLNYQSRIQLSVKMIGEHSLRVCLALGVIIVHVYDICLTNRIPSFSLVGSLFMDASDSHPRIMSVQLQEDLVLLETTCGRSQLNLLWNVRTGWYALAPGHSGFKNMLYWDKVIAHDDDRLLIYDIPIEHNEFASVLPTWSPTVRSFEAAWLKAQGPYVNNPITTIPLPTPNRTKVSPRLPLSKYHWKKDQWERQPIFELPPSRRSTPQGTRSIAFDLAFQFTQAGDNRQWHHATFLYRYECVLSQKGSGYGEFSRYEAVFKVLDAFSVPSAPGEIHDYTFALHPPGHLHKDLPFSAGSSFEMLKGSEPSAGLVAELFGFYSPDEERTDVEKADFLNNIEEYPLPPVRLTSVLDEDGAVYSHPCMASGRLFYARGSIEPKKRHENATYVADYLSSST